MDRRMDRVRCEEGEEQCDVYKKDDIMIEELEAQRQAFTRKERER